MMQSERCDVIDDVDRDKGSGACPVYETTNEMHVTESATASRKHTREVVHLRELDLERCADP